MPEPKPKPARRTPKLNTTVDAETRAILDRAAREIPGARSIAGALAVMAAEWAARNPADRPR
jgi:hypothetical protein